MNYRFDPSRRPQISISRETTFLERPIGPDGYIDYAAAVHESFRKYCTPEKNATVELMRALGPQVIATDKRDRYFASLGIPPLDEKESYFVSMEDYDPCFRLPENWIELPLEEQKTLLKPFEEVWAEQERLMENPWSAKEHPYFAEFLAANSKPLEHFTEGSTREFCYFPPTNSESCVLSLSDIPMEIREIARTVRLRVMLKLHSGEKRSAWENVMSCFRWSRLCGQGFLVLNQLIGCGIQRIAWRSAIDFIRHAKLDAESAEICRAQISGLPPLMPMESYWHRGERLYSLSFIQFYARYGYTKPLRLNMPVIREDIEGLAKAEDLRQEALSRLINEETIDWNEALRYCNQWFDRIDEAFDLPDYRQKNQALTELCSEMQFLTDAALNRVLMGDEADSPEPLGRLLTDLQIGSDCGSVKTSLEFEYQSYTLDNLLLLAFALAGYRSDHGRYPAELDELGVKYMGEIPVDLFTGEPLHYDREGDGYLLYSVGPNCIDDGGRNFMSDHHENFSEDYDNASEDEKAADDITIRIQPKKAEM